VQIYADFSGYSDIANRLGAPAGNRMPANFDAPYRARSLAEFWRRWHIALLDVAARLRLLLDRRRAGRERCRAFIWRRSQQC
jgi:hypothetical protein